MTISQNIHRENKCNLMKTTSRFHHQFWKLACVYTCLLSPPLCKERESVSAPLASSSLLPWTLSPFFSRALLLQLYHLPLFPGITSVSLSAGSAHTHLNIAHLSKQNKTKLIFWTHNLPQLLFWYSLLNSEAPQNVNPFLLSPISYFPFSLQSIPTRFFLWLFVGLFFQISTKAETSWSDAYWKNNKKVWMVFKILF